jgi:exodeoxyribonuclease VIII
VDLKTTVNAHPEAFARDAFKYRYHCQAAFYSDAKQIVENLPQTPRFCFIVVEKEFPYAVAVYWLDDQSIDLGRRVYRKDLETYAWCREIDSWPGYDEIRTLRLPRYAFVKESA